MSTVKISNLSTVWTSSQAESTAIRMNVIDTASSGSSKLMDLLVDSTSRFSIRKDGTVVANSFSGSLFGSSNTSTSSSFASYSNQSTTATSSSFAQTASFSQTANTATSSSFAQLSNTATSSSFSSYSNQSNTSTISSFSQQSNTATSSSFAQTANTAISSSQSSLSTTASYALNAGQSLLSTTASYALNAVGGITLGSGSSYNITSSWANTASYAMNSSGGTTLGSGSAYNITASYAISSSHSPSASVSVTASYALNANVSLTSGSSYNITASRSITSSYSVSSSHAVTASYAERYAPYWPSDVQITGSNLVPNDNNTVWYIVSTGSFTLIASALGSQPQYYKWYINSSSLIQSGSSNSLLVTNADKLSDSGYYTCQVTNSYGSATSANFQVQVLDPVTIQSEVIPGATPTVNSMVSFEVSPDGDMIKTRWKKRNPSNPNISNYVQDGVPSILNTGQNTTNLVIQAISPDSEGTYFCEVSNSISYTTSSNMLIYVTAPVITTQPSDLDNNGFSTVIATGSAISYSWEYNGNPITQQSASTLNLSQAVDDGYFTQAMMNQLYSLRCRVYNGVGYNISDAIQIKPFKKSGTSVTGDGTVQRAQQTDVVAIDASSQIFAPVGTTYAVYKGSSNVGSDTTAFGETMPKLTIRNVQTSDAGSYTVSASFNGKSVVSDAISLTVTANDSCHNSIPSTRYVFGDETHTFVCDYGYSFTDLFGVSLTAGTYYRWSTALRKAGSNTAYDQMDRDIQSPCPDGLSSPTEPNFQASMLTLTGTSSSGSITSSASSTTIKYQYALSYTTTVGGCPTQSLSTPDPWSHVDVDTEAVTGNTATTTYSGGTTFNCSLVSYGSLGISVHPSGSQTKATGSSVVLRTVASCGSATLNYRWYRNGVRIPDSDSNIYTISNVSLSDSGSYYCLVGAKSSLSYRTMQSSASMLVVV